MTRSTLTQINALLLRYYYNEIRRTKWNIFKDYISAIVVGLFIWITVGDNPSGIQTARQSLTVFIPIVLPIGYNALGRSLMFDVVNEKAEKYKEYLKINGTSTIAYSVSTFIYGYIKVFMNSVIILVALAASAANIGGEDLIFSLWVAYLCYGIIFIHFCMVYTTFFSTPKLCQDTGGIITAFSGFLFFLIAYSGEKFWYLLGSIIPQVWVNISLSTISGNPNGYKGIYGETTTWILFPCLALGYLALYAYLENVMPNEYGIKKNRLFCLKRKKNSEVYGAKQSRDLGINATPLIEYIGNNSMSINIEDDDYSSATFHEKFQNAFNLRPTIVISKLTKDFKTLKAVDNLSLTIFEKQIFCLLGHNGAGKTTMINMLTGMLDYDEGSILYDGEDFKDNFDMIRSKIGLCPQKDILYDNMTIEEHLSIIAMIRGMPEVEILQEIENVIMRVGLEYERGKLAKNLSGGNKRKLSLGMSIVGGVKYLFLDEPTSGMDPNSRRIIWDILRMLKNEGKTILLTTHHLEEADELSDRIGIMTRGKLFALGTADYMKKQFGEGYHLIIIPEAGVSSEQFFSLKDSIDEIINSLGIKAQKDEQTPPEVLKYLLPFSYQSIFGDLFQQLEAIPLINISLEMNTLEDAFIRIGNDEEKFLGTSFEEHIQQNSITVPESIGKNPEYRFKDQFIASFLRKFYCTIRSPQAIIMTCFPVVFVILGCFLSKGIFDAILSDSEVRDQEDSQTIANLAYVISYYLYIMMNILAFSLNSSIYCGFPVMERETRLRYALKVMGCRKTTYWLGTFAFDMVFITILLIMLIVFTKICEVPLISDYISSYFLILFSFVSSVICAAYFYGFMYQKASTAYKTFGVFCYFGLYMFCSIFLNLAINRNSTDPYSVNYQNQKLINGVKIITFIISPFLTLEDGLLCLVNNDSHLTLTISGFTVRVDLSQTFMGGSLFPQWYYYVFWMLLQAGMYMTLTIWLESRKYNIKPQTNTHSNFIYFSQQVPIDLGEINSETMRVSSESCMDPIKVINLSKTYPNGFQAINDISFGVEKGQIFGLLGPNGAGKSTTFNILTALIPRTRGSVRLLDTEIDNDLAHIFKEVGVCPQFDCLWEMLTVKEHLMLFGKMKGLNEVELKENIDYYIKVMTLTEHINKKSRVLSGGNKRKLCVTNSLIGSPSLQFFDEPSTGLDPVARRALWTTMTQNLQNRNASIILTTHSMPEAESLCHKIGILINGRFVCIGSTPYLKNRYGNGYKITIKKKPNSYDNIDNPIRQISANLLRLPSANVQFDTYQVGKAGFSFSKAFTILEKYRIQGLIADFSIYNTTLEQVFIGFSKYQYVSEI